MALYASLPGEVATTALVEMGWAEGRRILLPRVVDGGDLVFVEHLPDVPLVGGAFGVLEPPEQARVVDLDEAELILVPGLAFDRCGGRLGRGAAGGPGFLSGSFPWGLMGFGSFLFFAPPLSVRPPSRCRRCPDDTAGSGFRECVRA